MEKSCTNRLCCPDAVWLRRIQRAGTHAHPYTDSHCNAHTGTHSQPHTGTHCVSG